jgi:hypothetical protein
MTTPAAEAFKELNESDSKSLYEKLGGFATVYPTKPEKFSEIGAADVEVMDDVAQAGPLDELAALGKRILSRWNKVMYDLVCAGGGGDVDPDVQKSIFAALKIGSPEAVAAAITGVLISVFSVGPAIAAVVGVLLGRLLLPAAGKEVCAYWKEQL